MERTQSHARSGRRKCVQKSRVKAMQNGAGKQTTRTKLRTQGRALKRKTVKTTENTANKAANERRTQDEIVD